MNQNNNQAKSAAKKVWDATPAGSSFADGFKPGTREFFEKVLKKRSTYELPWLFELIDFSVYKDKKVLELGCGAGYDAYEFCRNEAEYTGIDLAPENVARTKKHLSFYGLKPVVAEGDAENLLFDDEIFDLVFSNGVLHHTPDIKKSFEEAYRVLKSGGEGWIIVYNRDSIVHWINLFLCSHILCLGFLKQSFARRLSMIEYSTSTELPLVKVYSRKKASNLLIRAGFTINHIWVRKLVHEDLPCRRFLGGFYKMIPQSLLDRIGKILGWYIIAKVTKL
jgi:ubiquinone/menaquinone biosynthesis C-methylase UbiE